MKIPNWKQIRDEKISKFLLRYKNTKLKKVYGQARWIRVAI